MMKMVLNGDEAGSCKAHANLTSLGMGLTVDDRENG